MDFASLSENTLYQACVSVLVLFLCVLSLECVRRAYSYREFMKHIRKIPGPYLHPIWGTMKALPPNEQGIQAWLKYLIQYPEERVSLLRVGPCFYFLNINYPEEIGELLSMQHNTLPKDDLMYGILKQYIGEGLIVSNYDKWQTRRRMLTPGFHYDILKHYVPLYNDVVDTFLIKCESKLENGKLIIPVFENMTLLTLDVMLQCVCSYKSDCQIGNEGDRYVNAVKDNSHLTIKQITFIPYLFRPIFYCSPDGFAWRRNCRIVKEEAMKVVHARRKTIIENPNLIVNKETKDFINLLLTSKDSSGNGLTDEGIVEEMTTFLFAGHDTTSSAMSWTLHALGHHPKYQSMCREEVRGILKGRESDTILWEDIPKLTFLSMCIKESMRFYTPVSYIYRMAKEDFHLSGYYIPKGTRFILSIGTVHRNPNVWENASEYNPMRFDCEMPGGHPFAFIPFSAGHRNCIGQKFAFNELVVNLGRIINKFEIESLTKAPKRLPPLILKAEEELKICLKLAK